MKNIFAYRSNEVKALKVFLQEKKYKNKIVLRLLVLGLTFFIILVYIYICISEKISVASHP